MQGAGQTVTLLTHAKNRLVSRSVITRSGFKSQSGGESADRFGTAGFRLKSERFQESQQIAIQLVRMRYSKAMRRIVIHFQLRTFNHLCGQFAG